MTDTKKPDPNVKPSDRPYSEQSSQIDPEQAARAAKAAAPIDGPDLNKKPLSSAEMNALAEKTKNAKGDGIVRDEDLKRGFPTPEAGQTLNTPGDSNPHLDTHGAHTGPLPDAAKVEPENTPFHLPSKHAAPVKADVEHAGDKDKK